MTCNNAVSDCLPCQQEDAPEPHTCRCGDIALPDGRYEHATVVVENGCITVVEAGEIPLYTPNVCCSGVGGGGSGAQGAQGDKGEPGENATITIGAVNTLAPGSKATVVNTGTETNAVLEFGIPAGDTGQSGSSTHGVTSDTGGIGIESGSIVSLPASWPPVLYILATSKNVGVTLEASEPDESTGIVNLTFDLTQYNTTLRSEIDTQVNNAVTQLQNQINSLNTALTSAQSAITDLQTRVRKLES